MAHPLVSTRKAPISLNTMSSPIAGDEPVDVPFASQHPVFHRHSYFDIPGRSLTGPSQGRPRKAFWMSKKNALVGTRMFPLFPVEKNLKKKPYEIPMRWFRQVLMRISS